MELQQLVRTILARLLADEPPLGPGDERQLVMQACTRLPPEIVALSQRNGEDLVQIVAGQEENTAAVLELRLRNLLNLHRMTPQDYAHLREQLVYRAYRQERNWTRAEDLVQETFLAMITNRHLYRGDSSYFTWVQSILFHRLNRHRLGLQQRREVSLSVHRDATDDDGSAVSRMMEWILEAQVGSETPEKMHFEQERMEKLLNHFPRLLTGKYELESVNLVMLQELEYEEAAAQLNISREYLYKIICGARRKLQTCEQIRAIMEDRDGQHSPESTHNARTKNLV